MSAPALRLVEHFWKQPPETDIGRAWGPQEKVRVLQLVLSTDASGVAWGAHVHGKWEDTQCRGNIYSSGINDIDTSKPAPLTDTLKNMRGQFSTQDQTEWIHILEYKAVLAAITQLDTHI